MCELEPETKEQLEQRKHAEALRRDWVDAFFEHLGEVLETDAEGLRATVEDEQLDDYILSHPDTPKQAADEELSNWADYGE